MVETESLHTEIYDGEGEEEEMEEDEEDEDEEAEDEPTEVKVVYKKDDPLKGKNTQVSKQQS